MQLDDGCVRAGTHPVPEVTRVMKVENGIKGKADPLKMGRVGRAAPLLSLAQGST